MKKDIIMNSETGGGACESKISRYRKFAAICFGVLSLNVLLELISLPLFYKQIDCTLTVRSFLETGWHQIALFVFYVSALVGTICGKSGRKLLFAGFSVYLLSEVYRLADTVVLVIKNFTGMDIGFSDMGSGITTIIIHLINIAAAAVMLFILLTAMSDRFSHRSSAARRLWFVPGLLAAVVMLYDFVDSLFKSQLEGPILIFSKIVSYILIVLFAAALLLKARRSAFGCEPAACAQGKGSVDMVAHVLLLLFTFGIWNPVWIYRTTDYLNCVIGEHRRSPAKKMLLCIFVPFYIVCWTYVSAKRIGRLAEQKGTSSNLTVICTILAVFAGIVPPVLMQEEINEIALSE